MVITRYLNAFPCAEILRLLFNTIIQHTFEVHTEQDRIYYTHTALMEPLQHILSSYFSHLHVHPFFEHMYLLGHSPNEIGARWRMSDFGRNNLIPYKS
jgi:hypothetical protein